MQFPLIIVLKDVDFLGVINKHELGKLSTLIYKGKTNLSSVINETLSHRLNRY